MILPLLLSAIALHAAAGASPAPPRIFTLDNGLGVVILPDPTVPLVALELRYAVGSAEDPPGRSGMAHLVEHLLFSGEATVGEERFDQRLEAAGGASNGRTTADALCTTALLPPEALAVALHLEASRLAAPALGLSEAALAVQRQVIDAELAESQGSLAGVASLARARALYPPGHPYHRPAGGQPEALAQVRLEEVAAFADAWIRPDLARLAIVGAVDADEAEALVRATLGAVPRPTRAPPPRATAPLIARSGELRLEEPADVYAPALYALWPTVPHGHPDEAALDLLATWLGGGEGALLAQGRGGRRRAVAATGAWTENGRLEGRIVLYARGAEPGLRLDRAAADLDRAIRRARRGGPGPAALEALKRRQRLAGAEAGEGLEAQAAALNGCALEGEALRCAEPDPAAVQAADLAAAARAWLRDDRRVLLSLTPWSQSQAAVAGSELLEFQYMNSEESASPEAPPPPERTSPLPLAPPPIPPAAAPAWPVPAVIAEAPPVWLLARSGQPRARVVLSLRQGWLDAEDPLGLRFAGLLLAQDRAGVRGRWGQDLRALDAELRLGVSAARVWAEVVAPPQHLAAALALAWDGLRWGGADGPPSAQRAGKLRQTWLLDRRSLVYAPAQIHALAVGAAVYPAAHPLRARAEEADLRHLDLRRARRAWEAAIAAGAPAVVGVGDLGAEALLAAVRAAWPGFSGAATPRRLAAPADRAWRALVDDPGARVARITVSLPGPGVDDPALPAAELAASVLGGAFTSRLNAHLREAQGLTYEASAGLRAWPGHGRLVIELGAPADRAVAAVLALEEALTGMRRDPPGAAEVERARRGLLLSGAGEAETLAGLALALGVDQTYGRAPDARLTGLGATAALPAEAVAAACQTLFDPAGAVWVISGDAESLDPALRAAGWPPDARWSAADVVAGLVGRP